MVANTALAARVSATDQKGFKSFPSRERAVRETEGSKAVGADIIVGTKEWRVLIENASSEFNSEPGRYNV
jgi:hypothetical protein